MTVFDDSRDRLAFVIQCQTQVDLDAGDQFDRGRLEGLRQVYDWSVAGVDTRDAVESWEPSEWDMEHRRPFLAGFRAGLVQGRDILSGRV